MRTRVVLLALPLVACGDEPLNRLPDAPPVADAARLDGAIADAPHDAMIDGSLIDAPAMPITYNCGSFTADPGWTLASGYHAVTIADAANGISQPVAMVVAGGAFGGLLYVVNQGDDTLRSVDFATGTTSLVVAAATWSIAPRLLTSIAHDATTVFDGNLYVGDQGGDGDGDSAVFRVTPAGAVTTFAAAPGPGLDDVFAMAFTPGGLHISGDTDGAGVDWGRFDAAGVGAAFNELAGVEGLTFDTGTTYGGALLAARPAGGGYAGDDTITRVDPVTGASLGAVVTARPGIHAPVIDPTGVAFGGLLHAASWSTGELFSITPAGLVTVLASGLTLSNYDGNILAFSPDGRVLYVADRAANRIVCIEPVAVE